jgi:membrane fusion protein, multidrug efflux system
VIEFASPKPQAGEYVARGTTLATITAPGPVRAEFQLPQSLRPAIKPGAPVEVTINAYPRETLTGTVAFISPEINSNSGTARAVADLKNPKGLELDGMIGSLSVTLSK